MTASMAGVRDEDLAGPLEGAIAGDASAFAVLWRALHPAVLRYLRVVCGEAAEDVASETWLQVSRDLAGFRGSATAFRVWVFRVARNRGIDENRRAWRRREEPHEAVGDLGEAPAGRDVAADVVDLVGTEWALRVIASLPREQAEAVMLRVVAGLDVAGTARVLGKRAGAVRVATMRGLRRLAEHPQVRENHEKSRQVPENHEKSGFGGANRAGVSDHRTSAERVAAGGGELAHSGERSGSTLRENEPTRENGAARKNGEESRDNGRARETPLNRATETVRKRAGESARIVGNEGG